MGKAAKRQRKKEARHARMEEQRKAFHRQRRRRLIINLVIVGVLVGLLGFFIVQNRRDDTSATPSPSPSALITPEGVACGGAPQQKPPIKEYAAPPMTIDQAKTYRAIIETSCGTITIELADDEAPQTVNAFVFLARDGFFDGLTFHRVVAGFAIQGGDPNGDGTGGSGFKVVEPPPAEFSYVKGVVAMAKGGAEPAGTSGSQFFIVPGDGGQTLEPEYALLGRVVEGDEILALIEEVPVAPQPSGGEPSLPLQVIHIVKITIEES
jgi:cyclophilin family peptidyl-prolyl cis-trans isomerase